jgi:hypothetical protein
MQIGAAVATVASAPLLITAFGGIKMPLWASIGLFFLTFIGIILMDWGMHEYYGNHRH